MQGQKVVKVFCHEEKSIEEFKELNDKLFHSADNANKFANIAMPVNAQVGNISYVIVAIVGGILAINGIGSFTLGGLASFLTFNKSLNMPIGQVSQQVNFVAMALAGAQRIFELLDEEPEVDEGYVTLVNATEDADGTIHETDKHTGTWAWKHFHKEDGTTTYAKLLGDVEFTISKCLPHQDKRLHSLVLPELERQRSLTLSTVSMIYRMEKSVTTALTSIR